MHGKSATAEPRSPSTSSKRRSTHSTLGRSHGSRDVSPRDDAAMFFKPLAHPSTLDRRSPPVHGRRSPSYVEEFWSPSLGRPPENRRLKHTLIYQRYFRREAPRVFLSRAGPRF